MCIPPGFPDYYRISPAGVDERSIKKHNTGGSLIEKRALSTNIGYYICSSYNGGRSLLIYLQDDRKI